MNLFEFVSRFNAIETIIGGFIVLLTGSIASFFIIKYQLNKNLEITVNVYKEEVIALSGKITRLQTDVDELRGENERLRGENNTLKFKKNYLKDIVMQALTSKKSIDKSMLAAIEKTQK